MSSLLVILTSNCNGGEYKEKRWLFAYNSSGNFCCVPEMWVVQENIVSLEIVIDWLIENSQHVCILKEWKRGNQWCLLSGVIAGVVCWSSVGGGWDSELSRKAVDVWSPVQRWWGLGSLLITFYFLREIREARMKAISKVLVMERMKSFKQRSPMLC